MRVEEKDNVDNPLLVREPQTERDGTPQDRSSRSWMVALVAFLKTLTDTSVTTDAKFSDPFDYGD